MPPRSRAPLRDWLLALTWTAVVLSASGDSFSADNSGALLEWILDRLLPGSDPVLFEVVHRLLRKTAHLVEYFILSLLWFRAFRAGSTDTGAWQGRFAAAAIAVALAVSSCDELLQWMGESRGGSLLDVILDLAGASAAQLWLRRRASVRQSNGGAAHD